MSSLDGSLVDLDGFLNATATDAMVVLVDGAVAHEFYASDSGPSSPHILMSATKSLIGLTSALLAEQGRLDPEHPVTGHVPEMADTPFARATLRDLLDMQIDVQLSGSQQQAYAAATGWDPAPDGQETGDLHAFFAGLKGPPAQSGGPFRYVSANYDLLGWALERATDRPLRELVSELLWSRLGAEHDALITVDPAGHPRATGGLSATVRDFARLGQLICDNGRDVIPRNVVEDLATAGDRDAWAAGEWGPAFAPISRRMSYRNGWYTLDDDPQILLAMGIHGQNLFIDRVGRIVVAKFSSWAEATDYAALPLTLMAVRAMRRHFAGAA